ncbi:phospholipase D-like domain-containing protein [Niabella drilacis]|uniref:Putative cardiolipin synthase n=1 Tax=Niabella drilacis (strain DSM 25811 / CCM 8410 / CCUG 62505 / LMG 26954 / E90) TaxID=1285928 RepID=A0A1G6RE59_NIADE|nr:phospholipase D-like domain-containing protein [Niabella drilacis]SDD02919.1 putative cardiolipin synthase [Niabella drilacis]
MSIHKNRKNTYGPQAALLLVRGGIEYFNLLRDLILTAEQCIHIQMYIFRYDNTGRMVIAWLRQASAKGVRVYLLVDGYATHLSADLLAGIKDAGVELKRFEPLFKNGGFYFGRRLHHKIVVADGCKALVGSNNIDDDYYGRPDHPAWLDMALFVEGTAAGALEQVCIQLWNKEAARNRKLDMSAKMPVTPGKKPGGISVGIRRNDWVHNRSEIWKSYFNLLSKAREDVYLVSSYFLPGKRLRRQMKLAARRGVKIRVVTAGLSDVLIAKQAERYLYPWLLRNRIAVYEYRDSVLHAKMGLRDGRWLTLGSFNINNISTYAGIELNLDVRNRPFVRQVKQELDQLIAVHCTVVSQDYSRSQGLFVRFIQRLSYNVIRIILYVCTFYFKQEHFNQ